MRPNPSPRRLKEHATALAAFGDAYRAYLAASHEVVRERRARAVALVPAAEEAAAIAGYTPAFLMPDGRAERHGLRKVAFDHETFGWQRESTRLVVDLCAEGAQQLRNMAARERLRRRHPFYWGDRTLRAILGLPAQPHPRRARHPH